MSFVIRSSNGQRSLTKITTSSSSQGRGSVRDEIIEALRGLTIKFEIKIADIFQDEGQQEPEQQADVNKDKEKQSPRKADDILTEIKTKLVNEQQLQQVQQQVQQQVNQLVEKQLRQQVPQQVGQTSTEQTKEVLQPRPASAIRPVVQKVNTTNENDFIESKKLEPEKVETVEQKTVDTIESRSSKLLDMNSKLSSPSQSTGTLVKGSLKIGSTLKTCCIWIDEDKQPPVPYISYSNERLTKITAMISSMSLSIEAQPPVSSIDVGDIVFAKSKDDNAWYRAIVERIGKEDLDVYLFDWGLTETLDQSRIRRLAVLELGLSKNPAVALKVKISNPPGPLVDRFLECDAAFDIRVDSYDEFDETYSITILGASDEQ